VHHPVLASSNLQKLYITAGQNNLFASQARLSANDLADEVSKFGFVVTYSFFIDNSKVEQLFEGDYDLEAEYHTLLDGMQCY
jgi:hypothetical protein